MMALIIDTETTGTDDDDEIIELGAWIQEFHETDDGYEFPRQSAWINQRFKPRKLIPPEVMAVHHITNEDLASEPSFHDWLAVSQNKFDAVTHYVAHNAEFEQERLHDAIPIRPWVCTYRSSLHVWPVLKSHRNASLRYTFMDPKPKDPNAEPHHAALPDAYVTSHLFRRLLGLRSLDRLIEMTTTPALLHWVNFGKHQGETWDKVPVDYLQWASRQKDMDPDVQHTVKHYLAEHYRKQGGRR